jgi:hypothetical protein
VRLLVLALLLQSGCSWRQRDFQKDMEKPRGEITPQVEVDKDVLEKFEVQPVETQPAVLVEEKKDPPRNVAKTNRKAVVEKKAPSVKLVAKNVVNSPDVEVIPLRPGPPPEDYPKTILEVNARARKTWQQYKSNHTIDQKVFLDISYLGMTVGKIMFTNMGKKMINNDEVWHFHARFKSAPFYSNIYELDDTVDTYVTTEQFLSKRFSLIQRESKQNIDDLQLFDREKYKALWFYKQKRSDGKIRNKQTEEFIPYFSVDPFSVLFFYQGLPLKEGDVYEIPIINKGKILLLKSVVEGRETVQTKKGPRKGIRVHATTQYSGEHLKSGDLYFWFSDDASRTMLKAQAKIKIGSVTAEIVE